MTPGIVAAVVLAGALGAVIRYGVTLLFAPPWAVLLVNVVGSAVAGAVLGLAGDLDPGIRLALVTGFAGGLTTYSTFAVETVELALEGRPWASLGTIVLNLVLGVGAAAAAYAVTR